MVEFGKQLVSSQRQEWSGRYIDYDRLKTLVKAYKRKEGRGMGGLQMDKEKPSNHSQKAPPPTQQVAQFRRALDQEIETVVLFLLERQGEIATQLSPLTIEREAFQLRMRSVLEGSSSLEYGAVPVSDPSTTSTTTTEEQLVSLQELVRRYRAVGESVLEFVAFVELNVTAVRKILKKHDKHAPLKLSNDYLSTSLLIGEDQDKSSHLHQLYHYGGLSALVATLQTAFGELYQLECHMRLQCSMPTTTKRANILSLEGSIEEGLVLLSPSHTNGNATSPQVRCITFPQEPILERVHLARRRLMQSTKYVELVAAQALMFEDSDEPEPFLRTEKMTRNQRISSFLNLLSTFLYMTNYYIIAPTSGHYAYRLGSTEAMAGIIIGMTPNAALVATVLYGWWSNYSYKPALLFAATSSVAGNVFYALALHHHSLTMIMVGRFLNGFGSARSINRRFIADTFSRNDRTAASAAFVTAGALGMAAGPAIAAGLGRMQVTESTIWTPETAPGWIMMGLWSVYLVVALVFFEEPDRSHLFQSDDVPQELQMESPQGGETKPLLQSSFQASSKGGEADATLFSPKAKETPIYLNVPVMMTLWIYFVLKLVLECLLSSSAILTIFYFDWNSQKTGAFLAFLGLLMFPANMVVARLSQRYEDRELIYVSVIVMFVSLMGFLVYTPSYSVIQYMIFAICIFVATNILEGANMSLLSKTIPKSWAKGTFNSGFLATEAGTAARSVGDLLISATAGLLGFGHLLNLTFFPLTILVFGTILLMRRYFDQMMEDDDDDDESTRSKPISSKQNSFGNDD